MHSRPFPSASPGTVVTSDFRWRPRRWTRGLRFTVEFTYIFRLQSYGKCISIFTTPSPRTFSELLKRAAPERVTPSVRKTLEEIMVAFEAC